MTAADDPNTPAPLKTPDFNLVADWHAMPDLQLQRIAHAADTENLSVSITLFLPWGYAAGAVISARAFFERQADLMREAITDITIGDDRRERLDAYISNHLEPIIEESINPDKPLLNGQMIPLPRQIHLVGVNCVMGGRQFEMPLLRARLSEVSAWNYGMTKLS